MNNSSKHLEQLDYLRGVAIVSVLLFHTLGVTFGYDVLPWIGWLRDFSGKESFLCFLPFSFGQAGVAVFFVVSGFCIHASFQQQGQNWRSFFIRRWFRIYPAYFAALIFFVLLNAAGSHGSDIFVGDFWKQLLAHLFLVHNADTSTVTGLNPSFWSLAVEAQLYLLYPALIYLVGKIGWRRAMFALAACELLIRGADGWVQTAGLEKTIAGNIVWSLANSPLGYWCSWSLGAYLADAFLKGAPLPFANWRVSLWLALAVTSYFIKPLSPFLFFLFALVTVIVAARWINGRSAFNLPAPALAVLKKSGLWSYSLYLLHQPLLNIYSYLLVWAVPENFHSAPVMFPLLVLTWVPIMVMSCLWYKLFELPGIAAGRQMIRVAREKIFPSRPLLLTVTLLALALATAIIGLKFKPLSPEESNNLAWSLATNVLAEKRDGARAVKLAEDACRRTQFRRTMMVGTLAAAYAEAGRFDDAITAVGNAITLAAKNGETKLFQRNQSLLLLYQNHQPYHDEHE